MVSEHSANFRKATVADAIYVAKHIRDEDRREIEGLGHIPALVLPYCVSMGESVAFFHADNPEKLMGVAGIMPDTDPTVGIVWMICTPEITNKPHTFVREAKRWLASKDVAYSYLWNLADARNHLHHKLLKMLGFKSLKVTHPAPYYIPYYEVVRLCVSPPLQSQQQR